jgi:DNA-binding transcriptional LysR family regulator
MMQWTDRIGRRLKLRDLHVLLTVVQIGSMAKAAETLSISQPVISKTIADLERSIGVRLLDRNPRGIEPTAYGRALLKRSLAAFDELRQGVQDIEFLADPAVGEVRIGSAEPMAVGLLPAIIARLSKQCPRIEFRVEPIDNNLRHFPELRERRIDLVLGRLRVPAEDDLAAQILFHDRLYVVADAKNPWARRRRIALAELKDEPWILPPPDVWTGSLVADAFRRCGLEPPRITVRSPSLHLVDGLLDAGFLGIASGSVLHYAGRRRAFKALAVDLPVDPRPTGILTLKNRLLTPAAELFIACAKEVAKPLARG